MRLKAAVWLSRSADRRAAQRDLLLIMLARLQRPDGEPGALPLELTDEQAAALGAERGGEQDQTDV
jgi:hypothetical protein